MQHSLVRSLIDARGSHMGTLHDVADSAACPRHRWNLPQSSCDAAARCCCICTPTQPSQTPARTRTRTSVFSGSAPLSGEGMSSASPGTPSSSSSDDSSTAAAAAAAVAAGTGVSANTSSSGRGAQSKWPAGKGSRAGRRASTDTRWAVCCRRVTAARTPHSSCRRHPKLWGLQQPQHAACWLAGNRHTNQPTCVPFIVVAQVHHNDTLLLLAAQNGMA